MQKIILTQGQFALVDDEDFDMLRQFKWYAQNTKSGFYACRRLRHDGKLVLMHRIILDIDDKSIKVDHRDRNTLNNTKNNLRIATHSQNMANKLSVKTSSSKYIGVSWVKRDKIWSVYLAKDNKKHFLGRFHDEHEAALAYNRKAVELHGEFASLNLVETL